MSPPQQEGRDGERDMAALSDEEWIKKFIEQVLEKIKPLPGRISKLLRRHGGRCLTAADDSVLRYWEFIRVELSGIVSSLSQMYSLSELGPDYADEYFQNWLAYSHGLAFEIWIFLDGSRKQPTLRDCHAQLHRAAARCFSFDARLPLQDTNTMRYILRRLCRLAESPCKYKNLLLAGDGDRTSRTSSSAQPHPYTADSGGNTVLVGIESALRNKKLKWFMANREDNKTLKIISMVGPAGVGKTTLAMEVYRQLQQIGGRHHFQCCATAKVSQRADIKERLKCILSQIQKPEAVALELSTPEDEEHDLLAGKINQCLQGKRYVIVIHDIWKESDWNIIKNAFPRDSPGSRILITTQLRSVAHFCCSHSADGLVHEVKPLSELDSKRLLFRKAFASEDGCPPENLKQVCDEILRRCAGIPLFIIGMAYWLQEQRGEVQHICGNYSMEIVPKLPKQFEQALATIYDELPYHPKLLLMYMSMFPEGYMFGKDSQIHNSIHYGILEIPCFLELVDRNVINRVAATLEHTQEENFHWQLNYFMLQFLASKSADKGLFFTSATLRSVVAGGQKPRRISLHQPKPELPTLLGEVDLSHTRSLAVSGKVDGIPLDKFIYLVVLDLEGWQCFKDEDMLRICKMFFLQNLSLRNTGVSKLPPEIKELQQLQMLDISHTRISELPSQVYQLSRLEKLDLRSTLVSHLPEQIWNLQHLLHLLVGGDGVNRDETAIEIPEGIGHLNFLSTLTLATVDLTQCSPNLVEALGGLRRLEVLAITWSFHHCTDGRFQEALRSSIEKWRYLLSLTIHCGVGCCMDFLDSLPHLSDRLQIFKISGGRFASLPQLFRGLDSLTFIEITVCKLLPGDLGTLGNLPSLECLLLGLHFIPEEAVVIEAVYPVEAEVDCVNDSVPSPQVVLSDIEEVSSLQEVSGIEEDVNHVHDNVSFRGLQRLSVSCRVPWLTFMQGAMPALAFLELKIAGSIASQESVPSGISNLLSLSDVAIHYNERYTNCLSVQRIVEAVSKGVAEHRKPINLFINGQEDQEDVQAVEEVLARAT